MSHKIGLTSPLIALFLYGVIYNPWLTSKLPPPQIYFLLASIWIIRQRSLSSIDLGTEVRNLPKRIALGFSLGLLPGVAVISIAGLLTLWGWDLLGGMPIHIDLRVSRLLTLIVLAPVCEELFFRGVLLRAIQEEYPTWIAVVLSSVIFMLGHGGWFVPGPLLLGLVVAPMTIASRSIVPGIIFHAISNAYGPIMIWWFPNLYRHLAFFYQ